MLDKQQQLYQRICDYELDDSSHEFGFLAHLMGANGWSRSFALRAIEEYRKFVFLALVADHPVTPSDQVDQVWHLHLLCSDAYWNDFCPRVLGRPLHHHPAKGGQAERDRFHEQYRATIRSYRQHFGEPPADLWPPVDVRFGRDLQMQRGPIRRMFRPWRGWRSWHRWRWPTRFSIVLVGLGLMGCGIAKAAAGASTDAPPLNVVMIKLQQVYQQTPQDLQGRLLVLLGILVATIIFCSLCLGGVVSSRYLRPLLLQPSCLSTKPQLDDDDLAYLSAGPSRVVELGLASLVQAGVLIADPYTLKVKRLRMGRIDETMPGSAQQVLRVCRELEVFDGQEVYYKDIVAFNRYDFTALRKSLQSKELLLKGLAMLLKERPPLLLSEFSLLCFVLSALPILFLLVLPNTPFFLDLTLLPYFILFNFILGLGLCLAPQSDHTLWGDAVLRDYQSASTEADPLRQVALLGLTGMRGGRLDDLRSLIVNVKAAAAAAAAFNSGCGGCA